MRRPFWILLVPLFTGSALGACSDQGEGEICSLLSDNSGNNDCQSGLTCQAIPGVNGARCCPADRTQATTAVCSLNNGVLDASPAPPDATGGAVDSGTEASGDAFPDSPAGDTGDAASDAPTE